MAVEAVRVHGAEGMQGCTPIHTRELPDSLAWLSPTQQLTFGKLDHQVKLRWHTLGKARLAISIQVTAEHTRIDIAHLL